MATNGKVVVNLATGLEDPERVTVSFLVAGAAAQAGREVTMFLSREAVRLALPGVAQGIARDGCPALPTLAAQYAQAGGRMLVCQICFNSRKLSEEELIDGAQLGAPPRCRSGSTKAPPSSVIDHFPSTTVRRATARCQRLGLLSASTCADGSRGGGINPRQIYSSFDDPVGEN
jgi:predicted peroxiredoxin